MHLHPNCLEATIFIDAVEDVVSKGIALSSNTLVNELLKWPHQTLWVASSAIRTTPVPRQQTPNGDPSITPNKDKNNGISLGRMHYSLGHLF